LTGVRRLFARNLTSSRTGTSGVGGLVLLRPGADY